MRNKLITCALAATLLAGANCSSARVSTPQTNANAANNASGQPAGGASPAATQNSSAASQGGAIKSVYTDLDGKGCGPARTTGEISAERTCTGIEGYKLIIQTDDDRDSITIITPDGREHPLNFWEKISNGAFNAVGQKAEWRVKSQNGKDVPVALIVRVEVQSQEGNKTISYLAVSKITEQGICVTDRIDPVANANEKAREAADSSAAKPCL